jgi:Holliday junction resolvase RusA-like endonuclease
VELVFVVEGSPRQWQRVKRSPRTGRVYKPRETREYQQLVAWKAHEARALLRRRTGHRWDIDGRFAVLVEAYYPDARRRDTDNAVKIVLDALKGVLWRDDAHRWVPDSRGVGTVDRLDPRLVVTVRLLSATESAEDARGGTARHVTPRSRERGAQAREQGEVRMTQRGNDGLPSDGAP